MDCWEISNDRNSQGTRAYYEKTKNGKETHTSGFFTNTFKKYSKWA